MFVKHLGRPKKYCGSCAKKKKLQQMRWHRWKQRYWGTTSFSQKRKKDFDKELEDIKKEKKRLRLL